MENSNLANHRHAGKTERILTRFFLIFKERICNFPFQSSDFLFQAQPAMVPRQYQMKQICAALLILSALFVLCGCGRNAIPPAAAAASQTPPPPQLSIQSAQFLEHADSPTSVATVATNRIRWKVVIAEFAESAIEQHGLKQLFDKPAEKNTIISEEIPRSHLVTMARADSNIVLTLSAGVYAGVCTIETASNLATHFKQTAGVDILTQPQVTTSGTNQAQLYVGNNIPVVTGASTNANPRTPFMTNLSFGHTVTPRVLSFTPDTVQLEAVARFDEFRGYSRDYQPRPSPPSFGDSPIFDVTVLGTRTVLKTNQVLLLGSPPMMNIRKTIDRIPRLSDIPGIGRLFTKTHIETNFVRRLVIIIPHRE